MQEKIINLLRKEKGYLSGEEISQRIGITRAGIWKQIENLRRLGYEIEAFPHRGYRLLNTPDRLLPEEISWELGTKIMGKNIFSFTTLDSTMDFAYELGLKDFPEGTIVCSETQRKGRGRLGRSWVSPKYKGLYFSILLRPKILPHEASKFTLLSAVAVREAIVELTGLECLIKWPNDLLVNERKVGGILTEMQAETDRVKFLIIGIGINVNTEKRILPSQASSLKEEKGEKISRIELLKESLRRLERYYLLFQGKGFSPIIREGKKYSAVLGHQIKIVSHQKIIEGEAIDLDSEGALLVRRESGFMEKVLAGDVVRVR
ncbi:MAG: biotin--[acetyl-CoA-carboxylase] ligase [Candidatus Omnitrophica bacterium]|nr:biotin--[acetyl-CoA-carboxylase] ligase [Candidatus Omnitrophota bacterium]MCM8793480.1 biotin--[acetyl-CoA-carboxylase] ligase [Candidatus Omnitrophota bacterium]